PRLAGDRVVHHALPRPGARMHADEERCIAALRQEPGVVRPFLLHDILAGRVEQIGHQGVEVPWPARAVAIHDHDLGRTGGAGAPHRRIDLLGVEAAAFLVHLMPTGHLLPLDDARDAFHVANDVDAHHSSLLTVPIPSSWRADRFLWRRTTSSVLHMAAATSHWARSLCAPGADRHQR